MNKASEHINSITKCPNERERKQPKKTTSKQNVRNILIGAVYVLVCSTSCVLYSLLKTQMYSSGLHPNMTATKTS